MKRIISLLTTLVIAFIGFCINVKVGIYRNPPQVDLIDGKPVGLYAEIIERIAQKHGWKVEYVYDSFTNLIDRILRNDIDVMTSIAYTEERAKLLAYNNQALLMNWGVICSTESITSLLQLDKKRIAISTTDVYAAALKKILSEFNLTVDYIEVSDYVEALRQVKQKNADAAVVSRIFAVSNASKYGLKVTTVVFSPIELRFAFPKDSEKTPILIQQIDEYLTELKSDEKAYNELLGRYLGTIVEKKLIPKWLIWLLISLGAAGFLLWLWNKTLESVVRKRTKELNEALKELEERNQQLSAANAEIEARSEEIKAMNEQLTATNEELEAQSQELKAMNEELETVLGQLERSLQRFTDSVDTLSSIIICEDEQVEGQIRSLIKIALDREDVEVAKDAKKKENSLCFNLRKDFSLIVNKSENLNIAELEALNALAKLLKILLEIREYLKKREEFSQKVINVLLEALRLHESHTAEHAKRLAEFSKQLALRLGLDREKAELVGWAALVHDIGKLAVDKDILNKPGMLSKEEFEKLKLHSVVGAELLKMGGLEEIATIVKYHHERCDGRGYPDGLKEGEIPIESRILCVIDAFDAMTSDRPYRKAMTVEQAIEELRKKSGTQFDPKVVEAFLDLISQNAQ